MKYLLLGLLFLADACFAFGGIYWEPCKAHAKEQNKISGKHQMHGGGATMLALIGADDKNISVSYLLPDLSSASTELKYGMITPRVNMGGYYALTAFVQDENGTDFAVRYMSANGKPVKVSPVELTKKQKNLLEITPNPLPREHDRYTASKEYGFTVLYGGKPLVDEDVSLKIGENIQVLKTTRDGNLKVLIPNDFVGVTPQNRQSKEFVLSVSKKDANKTHTASFSAPYYPNPNDWWQYQSMGIGGIIIGFLAGIALYMRRKDRK